MSKFAPGQKVKHKNVPVIMTVNSPAALGYSSGTRKQALRAGYTNCTYELNKQTIQKDFPTNELTLAEEPPHPLANPSLDAAVDLMAKAVEKLVAQGVSVPDALNKIKKNFDRLNKSGASITLESLCM